MAALLCLATPVVVFLLLAFLLSLHRLGEDWRVKHRRAVWVMRHQDQTDD